MPSKQDLVTMIVDILRAKQETEALNQGGQVAPRPPVPGMLGTGGAARAGQTISGRDKQIMDYVNSAAQ